MLRFKKPSFLDAFAICALSVRLQDKLLVK